MKRIINGETYNTDTATVIAEGGFEDEGRGKATEETLYQNRAGVFFSVERVETKFRDRYDELQTREIYEWYVVGDPAKARALCERHGLTIVRDIDDMPPEAEAGETAAPIYVRAPSALKLAIEAQAKAEKVSVNVFALRCLEECLKRKSAA
jgi:hypothetical protein